MFAFQWEPDVSALLWDAHTFKGRLGTYCGPRRGLNRDLQGLATSELTRKTCQQLWLHPVGGQAAGVECSCVTASREGCVYVHMRMSTHTQ